MNERKKMKRKTRGEIQRRKEKMIQKEGGRERERESNRGKRERE